MNDSCFFPPPLLGSALHCSHLISMDDTFDDTAFHGAQPHWEPQSCACDRKPERRRGWANQACSGAMKRTLTFFCVFPHESGRRNMQEQTVACRKTCTCVCDSTGGGVACEEMFLGPLRVMGWGQLLKCLFYVSCDGVMILLLLKIAEICSLLLSYRPLYKYSLASLACGESDQSAPPPSLTPQAL